MTAFDALRVSLPVGTVSGAPKIRAMQIIDELEPTRRGPYGGAVGYLDFAGNMDTCIALRTIVWHNGIFDVQAGAGVVADSVPANEYEETMTKAKAMLKAVEIAEKGFWFSHVACDVFLSISRDLQSHPKIKFEKFPDSPKNLPKTFTQWTHL